MSLASQLHDISYLNNNGSSYFDSLDECQKKNICFFELHTFKFTNRYTWFWNENSAVS